MPKNKILIYFKSVLLPLLNLSTYIILSRNTTIYQIPKVSNLAIIHDLFPLLLYVLNPIHQQVLMIFSLKNTLNVAPFLHLRHLNLGVVQFTILSYNRLNLLIKLYQFHL